MAKGRYAQALEDSLQDEISQLQVVQIQQQAAQGQQQAVGDAEYGAAGAAPEAEKVAKKAAEVGEEAAKESADRSDVVLRGVPATVPPPMAQPSPASPPLSVAAPARSAAPQGAPTATTQGMVETLDQRIDRLNNIRTWLQQDDDLARLIDGIIGKQVRASERRQARLSVVLNVVFLLAGWGLSLISTPSAASATLGHILGH
jgi:hypothetical protein